MIDRKLGLALALPTLLLAQPPAQSPPSAGSDTSVGSQPTQWRKLTAKDKLRYDWRHLFDTEHLVYAGMGAGVDQLRGRPPEWDDGWGGLGERYASHFGQYVIQRSIMFPVQVVEHEDTRYFPSKRKSLHGRFGDALLSTIRRYDDDGERMPAYSEFFGDYGAAAISRFVWWPRRFHNASAIFIAGSDTVLIDAGINVLHEFAPDVKRKLHLTH
jgi:hypothetical protein